MEVLLRDEQRPQRDKRKRHSADYSSFESPIVCIRLIILWSLFNKLRFFLNILYSMTKILSLKPVFLFDLYGETYGSNQIHNAMTKVTILYNCKGHNTNSTSHNMITKSKNPNLKATMQIYYSAFVFVL